MNRHFLKRPPRAVTRAILIFHVLVGIGLSTTSSASPVLKTPAPQLVFDFDFPDPSIITVNDGFSYAYATQTLTDELVPRLLNIQIARTNDLKNWHLIGDALPVKPSWASQTQKFWAPHIIKSGPTYFLYFSAEPDLGRGLCLGVATSRSPVGPFTDSGQPLACGQGFENIDPMAFHDPRSGRNFLYWGSGFGPIRVRELASNRVQFKTGTKDQPLIFPDPAGPSSAYNRLIEGAWMHEQSGRYYLFFSGSDCCEPNPHYAVMVARSHSPLGPFEIMKDANGEIARVVEADEHWLAPGHNALIRDEAGTLWIYYHAIDRNQVYLKIPIPGDRKVRRVLLRQRLRFKNGWPYLA